MGVIEIYIDKTAVVEKSAQIGDGTKIWHFCHIDENAIIGKNCVIGQNAYIGKNAVIGDNVKIQNNVSVYSGVIIKDNVFCGPSCVFTNDLTPRSRYPKKKGEYMTTIVDEGATIGGNATIICNNKIGENAFVGAGTVVTRNIKDGELVVGNPQQHIGWVCSCGQRLTAELLCKNCKKRYYLSEKGISVKNGTKGY